MAEAGKGKAKGQAKGKGKADAKGEELEMEEGGGKSKKMIIIIVAVVLLVVVGVGAYFMFGSSDPDPSAQEATLGDDSAAPAQEATPIEASVSVGTALYVAMPRPFVFNVPGSVRDRLVQIKVQLLVRGDSAEEQAKRHIPLIEGALLKTFSATNADDLSTTIGKETLKGKALQDVQATMINITGKKIIERVLFTGFVMQ
ncbi:MAG: flagellar basal body-associated protein FliL [Algicola sp.]|nr:flagellar basal body-associated protein FliL [Algicola sp.]